MVDIQNSQYYNITKFMLSCVGLWPYQHSVLKFIIKILIITGMASAYLPEIIMLFEVWGNFDNVFECLPSIFYYSICILKFIGFIISENKMYKLFDSMQLNWSSLLKKEELQIMHDYSEKGRKLVLYYMFYMFIGAYSGYTMLPLTPIILDLIVPLNESRPRQPMTQAEYFVDSDDYFYSIYLHNILVGFFIVAIFVGFDTTFMIIIHHICGMLAIANERLKNSNEMDKCEETFSSNVTTKNQKTDYEIHQDIIAFVHIHRNALEFIKILESAFTGMNLIILGYVIITLALAGVQTLVTASEINQSMRFCLYCVGTLMHLFSYNWLGQQLTNHSEMLFETAYTCFWYEENVSPRSKFLLRIIMLKCLSPCKLTGGKIYDLSHTNFIAVLRLSMSYFTILRSVK